MLKRGFWALIVMLSVIVADQALKFYIKTSFFLGEDYEILSWFHIKFIENPGMAFGMELPSKMLLTGVRILAVAFLVWALCKLRNNTRLRTGFFMAMALITAGAAGNIFDCVFYGEIFSNPMPPQVAEFLPKDGGYAPWFHGMVVDMLYFPMVSWTWPQWFPVVGGQEYEFFQYIFNLADASICVGTFLLILFYSRDFSLMLGEIAPNIPFTEAWRKAKSKES